MRLFRPCFFADWLYPEAMFRIKTTEKFLCLTFDDGPDPGSTPELIDILDRHQVKAIFFSDGRAAEKYSDLIGLIKSKGHLVGNHGYRHLNGWSIALNKYIADVEIASVHTSSSLFRPPYGRLTPCQYRRLKAKYKIVFWDIMPYDFDRTLSSEVSYKHLLGKLHPGSIIVLHDNPGSSLFGYLSEFIETATNLGYRFVLPDLSEESPCF
jgi:peptidoglycan/xylan/chitin deacetylase (PgdA/CDA1 family)